MGHLKKTKPKKKQNNAIIRSLSFYWHVKDGLEFGEIRDQENNKEVIAMFHTKD